MESFQRTKSPRGLSHMIGKKMIKLSYITPRRKIVSVEIENKVVKYFDENWTEGIQIIPSQTPEMKLMLKKMLVHRKPAIRAMGAWIVESNSGKNLEEYKKCKTDKDLAKVVHEDCLSQGLLEVK
jgi:hypothetical protein